MVFVLPIIDEPSVRYYQGAYIPCRHIRTLFTRGISPYYVQKKAKVRILHRIMQFCILQ
jgi:hypothetical protein